MQPARRAVCAFHRLEVPAAAVVVAIADRDPSSGIGSHAGVTAVVVAPLVGEGEVASGNPEGVTTAGNDDAPADVEAVVECSAGKSGCSMRGHRQTVGGVAVSLN